MSNFLSSLFALFRLFSALMNGHSGPKMLNASQLSLFNKRLKVRMCVCRPGIDLYCVGTLRGMTAQVHSTIIVRQL